MEEAKSVIGVICSSYDSFFDSEKKIANCIMERKREVVDMTVAELAQASGASDASVSRFCRRCGFKGFHQLKMTLARELSEESQASVGNDISRRDIGQSLQNILANKTEEIRQTVAMMDPENLDRILDIIQKARMVQLVAVGNTIPVALDAAFKFNQLGIPAATGTILETQTAYAFNLGKKDVIIAISNSGVSRRLIRILEGASGNGGDGYFHHEQPGIAGGKAFRLSHYNRNKGKTAERRFPVFKSSGHYGDRDSLSSFICQHPGGRGECQEA